MAERFARPTLSTRASHRSTPWSFLETWPHICPIQSTSAPDSIHIRSGLGPHLQMASELGTNLYLDDITNDFNKAYASWPFRFWALNQDKVVSFGRCRSTIASAAIGTLTPFLARHICLGTRHRSTSVAASITSVSWPSLGLRQVMLKPMPKGSMYDLGELERYLAAL